MFSSIFTSVRARLTLWYLCVFGLLLLEFSALVYVALSRSLNNQLDRSVASATYALATEFMAEIVEYKGDAKTGASETLSELQLPDIHTSIFAGSELLASNFPEAKHIAFSEQQLAAANAVDGISYHTLDDFGKHGARMAILPVQTNGGQYFVVTVEPLDEMVEQIQTIRRIFYIGLPVTLLIAGLVGFLLAKKSFTPVVEMAEQARRISATNLEERLTVRNPRDELGHLAGAFNELLSRLHGSFEQMRNFMADASHELRTPLSIIRGEADVALSQERDGREYRETLSVIQDEASRLSRIVDDMLALARADAGQHPLHVEELYLNDVIEDACRAMQMQAEDKGVFLTAEKTEDVSFQGDEDLLRRLLLNLLDNAIKYTPAGGSVRIWLVSNPATIKIIVADSGIGIPAESVPHVFERFYRVGESRSRVDGGSGLGLSIAKWVAESHKGTIDVVSDPGRGSTFTVTLPRQAV